MSDHRRDEEMEAGPAAEDLLSCLPSAPSPVEPAGVGSPAMSVYLSPVDEPALEEAGGEEASGPSDSVSPVIAPLDAADDSAGLEAGQGEAVPVEDHRGAGGLQPDGAPEGGSEGEAPEPTHASSDSNDDGVAASDDELLQQRIQGAGDVVRGLFERLGAHVDVEVRDTDAALVCYVRVKRGAAVLEVGPRGQVLESIQYLANRMVGREVEGRKRITVEIGGFRDEGGEPAMVEMARRLADSARRIRKTLTIVPIQSRDRRVIHTSLAGMPDLKTRSEGEGNLRRLLIEVEPVSAEGGENGEA